jgi:hypothetical protein
MKLSTLLTILALTCVIVSLTNCTPSEEYTGVIIYIDPYNHHGVIQDTNGKRWDFYNDKYFVGEEVVFVMQFTSANRADIQRLANPPQEITPLSTGEVNDARSDH